MNPRITIAAFLAAISVLAAVAPAQAKYRAAANQTIDIAAVPAYPFDQGVKWRSFGRQTPYRGTNGPKKAAKASTSAKAIQRPPQAEPDMTSDAGGLPAVVVEAKRWIGSTGSIVHRGNLWCAAFMNFTLKRAGFRGSGSNFAASFKTYGPHVAGPRVGAIAFMKGLGPTGHVGIVSGVSKKGNPIIISGNIWRGARPASGGQVLEIEFPKQTVLAYVMPEPSVAMLGTPGAIPVYEDEAPATRPAAIKTEFDRALVLASAEAKEYLIATARPGTTMTRQGVEESIGNLHPVFAVRMGAAVRQARAAGLPDVGLFSAFRAPALGVGGFRNKYESAHTFGLAGDMKGIGRPGSPEAKKWNEIATENGLYNPYFGTGKWVEFNHYQAVAIKVMPVRGSLRASVTKWGPEDREHMWAAADPFFGRGRPFEVAAWKAAASHRDSQWAP